MCPQRIHRKTPILINDNADHMCHSKPKKNYLKLEILIHLPYSTALLPTDYNFCKHLIISCLKMYSGTKTVRNRPFRSSSSLVL